MDNKKREWSEVAILLILAFWIGVFFTLGVETVKYWYPSKSETLIIKHQYESLINQPITFTLKGSKEKK